MSMSMSSTKFLPNETFLKKIPTESRQRMSSEQFSRHTLLFLIRYNLWWATNENSQLPCRHNQISPTKHVGTKQNLHNTKIYTTQSNIFLTRMNYKIYRVRLFRILYLNMQQNRRQIQPVVYFDYIETIVLSLMDSVLEIGRQWMWRLCECFVVWFRFCCFRMPRKV